MQRVIRVAVPALALVMLSACASRPQATNAPVYSPARTAPATSVSYGTVRGIEAVNQGSEASTGAGAVVGGVIGAVVGRQFADSNSGKNVGTVAGAVGGALIGNEVEKNRTAGERIEVRVRLDSGARVTYSQESPRDFRNGDRVRIEDGRVFRG